MASEFINLLRSRVSQTLAEVQVTVRVLGPAPAPLARLRGQYRFHLQLQGDDRSGLRDAIRIASADLTVPEDVTSVVDVDPLDML